MNFEIVLDDSPLLPTMWLNMTPNRRIFLNVVATYGRSLYALVVGLFCGRWTFLALGEQDFGLFGLVGGLVLFVSFFNRLMESGIGRFYAICEGEIQLDAENGLEHCHKWFTTGVVVHTFLPLILVMVGYPLGEWVVEHYLTIPPDRLEACRWVWRFSCFSCFIGMVGVPFSAWYGAKQEIAELTVYGFATTTLNALFLYYMVSHPGDWLSRFALWTCMLSVIPQLIVCFRAGIKYRECRFRWRYVRCWSGIKEILHYSGWLAIGTLGDIFSVQGMNILINRFFGPCMNAAQNVANTVKGHSMSLSGSLLGAFWPAIINAYGAKQFERMRILAYQVCKFAPLCMMVFAIPLALEMDEVLTLWLKNPPSHSAGLCILGLIVVVGDYSTHGFAIAMHATGDIARYQLVVGGVYLSALPLAFLFLSLGGSVYWTGIALILGRWACTIARMIMARKKTGMSFRYWVRNVFSPLFLIALIVVVVGLLPRLLFQESFVRICITTLICEITIVFFAWRYLLDVSERQYVVDRLRRVGCFSSQNRTLK